ncbi:MAG: MSMEG_4193 family putative phosphomutase [Actinobacteria bacterium]|nr:MSMEG_4193 family putative phosphomutase [Actinomycetota bacterium]
MSILLLIRHAVTEETGKRLIGTTPGISLSAQGEKQALRLAEWLDPVRLDALYSSPLERCEQTAATIALGRRISVRPLADLREVEYGAWTGRSLRQVARTALWRTVQRNPGSARFPDGESLAEVQRRGVAALEEISNRHPRGVVGVVSHGDVIRLALAHYAGIHIDLFQRLIVGPASVSSVGLGRGSPRILSMNDTGDVETYRARTRRRSAPGRRRNRVSGGGADS